MNETFIFVYSECIVSSLIRYYFLYIDPIRKKPEIVTHTKKRDLKKLATMNYEQRFIFPWKKNRKETNNYCLNPNGILYKVFCFNFFYRSASYTIHIVTLWWIIYETCFSVHSTKQTKQFFSLTRIFQVSSFIYLKPNIPNMITCDDDDDDDIKRKKWIILPEAKAIILPNMIEKTTTTILLS